MTFNEEVISYLESRGMFPDEASQVLEMVQASKACERMRERWGDNASNYPEKALTYVLLSVNYSAIEWIDTNAPKAWYRSFFLMK